MTPTHADPAAATSSELLYSTRTGNPNHADAVARIHGAQARQPRHEPACRTTEPEPHLAGEFPMSCYYCHVVADA